MRSVNYFEACKASVRGESFIGQMSLTVPDQAISPAELLRRFASGQPLGFKNVDPVYDSEVGIEVPEFFKLSKMDRLHLLQENSSKVAAYKAAIDHYQNNLPKDNAEKADSERSDSKADSAKSEVIQ